MRNRAGYEENQHVRPYTHQTTELGTNCAKLWNEVTYERRQALFARKKFVSYPKHLYQEYAPLVGSATAQQVINKNNEAWRLSRCNECKLEANRDVVGVTNIASLHGEKVTWL